jgi:hypothetical protein
MGAKLTALFLPPGTTTESSFNDILTLIYGDCAGVNLFDMTNTRTSQKCVDRYVRKLSTMLRRKKTSITIQTELETTAVCCVFDDASVDITIYTAVMRIPPHECRRQV